MLKTLLGAGLMVAALALGQPAAAQSPTFTFVLDVVDSGHPMLKCFEEQTCNRATNDLARKVYDQVNLGQLPLHQGPLDYYFNVWGISGQGLDRVVVKDGRGTRVVQAITGCTHTTSVPLLGGPPQVCFHLQGVGVGRLEITFPREFFTEWPSASWCDPEMTNGVRPTRTEGIPYEMHEMHDKLHGLGGFPDKTVTFAVVRSAYAQPPAIARVPAYGYAPAATPVYAPPTYAYQQQRGYGGPSPGPSR